MAPHGTFSADGSSAARALGPASDAICAALGLSRGAGSADSWEQAARSMTYSEVDEKLRQADLGGLTDAVWSGLKQVRERPPRAATPTLSVPDETHGPMTPAVARQPLIRSANPDAEPSRVQQLVPVVEFMHGRVPRSQESWQYFEGENGCCACWRAFRLVAYNLGGTLLCLSFSDDVHRNA
jgi:hypothetical protein